MGDTSSPAQAFCRKLRELSRIRPARQTFSKMVGLAVFGADALSSLHAHRKKSL
jgi:hypothetical protein